MTVCRWMQTDFWAQRGEESALGIQNPSLYSGFVTTVRTTLNFSLFFATKALKGLSLRYTCAHLLNVAPGEERQLADDLSDGGAARESDQSFAGESADQVGVRDGHLH